MSVADADDPDGSVESESLSYSSHDGISMCSDRLLAEAVRLGVVGQNSGTPAASATRGDLLAPGASSRAFPLPSEEVGRSLDAQPVKDRTRTTGRTPTVSDEEKRKLAPRDSAGELLSYGSRFHAEGGCFPCLFHHAGRCVTKELCEFCHYLHTKPISTRRSKPVRRD